MISSNPMTITTPTDREIVITRMFNAPRERVFKAMTDPELLAQWWGPDGATTIIDKMEARTGGDWRYVQRLSNGEEHAFRGTFREVTPPERLVYTFEWEGMPGYVLLETVTLEEIDGKTQVTDTSLFYTSEERDGMLQSGMEEGARASWERLEALLSQA